MAVNYSTAAINARLQGVVTTIDGGGGHGVIKLLSGATVISTITLALPSATVNGGVLTFSGSLIDPSAANTGNVNGARIEDSTGATVISGLTVGVPPATTFDILISNGLNSTLVTAGQVVSVVSAQITGS